MAFISDFYNYWMAVILMMIGLYIIVAQQNLIKKVIGLNIFQTSIFFFYISVGKVSGGSVPILPESGAEEGAAAIYSNPLPHVLILTAIVVGVATLALALALVVRINEAYGSIEEREIVGMGGDE